MKSSKFILIGVILLIFLLAGPMLFYSFYVIKEVHLLPADVYISDGRTAFNLDKDLLHFGIVALGTGSAARHINVTNNWDHGVDVILGGKGELGDWLAFKIEENNKTYTVTGFYLGSHESKEVDVHLIPGPDAKIGEKYIGSVRIILKRHKIFRG